MVITIPMSQIGLEPGNEGGFYFKWTDNPESLDTPISLCTNGDTAPNRRFCYNYSWKLLPIRHRRHLLCGTNTESHSHHP